MSVPVEVVKVVAKCIEGVSKAGFSFGTQVVKELGPKAHASAHLTRAVAKVVEKAGPAVAVMGTTVLGIFVVNFGSKKKGRATLQVGPMVAAAEFSDSPAAKQQQEPDSHRIDEAAVDELPSTQRPFLS